MGYYKKICMLSGVPIKKADSVKIFFLCSTGNYKSNKTIFVGNLVYPWSAFKVVAGLSIDAIYKGYDQFDIIDNIKSKTVLKYLQTTLDKSNLNYEDMFKLISDGETFIENSKDNTFLSAGYVHEDIYNNSIVYLKEQYGKYDNVKEDFKRYLFAKNKAIEKYKDDEDDNMSEELVEPEIGYLQQYIFGRRNPYKFIKKNIIKDYNEHLFFEDFSSDIYFIEVMKETGNLLTPNMDLHEDIANNIKSKILQDALIKSLKARKNEEYLSTNVKIDIFQEVFIKDIILFYEEINEHDSENFKNLRKFITKNKSKNKLLIKKENIINYPFLSNILYDDDKDLMILF